MESYANTAQILLNNDWYFSKERLADSPSRKSGIDAAKELSYRQQAANFIQDMGQRLQVSQLCINTAIVYMHRFYVFHSFKDIHRNSLSIAALFLAAKVEEQPRKLEHVIKVAHMCIHKDASPLDVRCEAYQEKVNETVAHENILLACLGFILAIEHPHTYVVKVCQLVRASKDLAQTSYIMATTSLHMTMMCLQYKPPIVACVCIHLACKWSSYKIEPCSQGKDWFYYVDRSVTWPLLERLTQDYISILERSPHRFKNKFVRDEPNGPSTSTRYTPPLGDILSDSVPPSIPRSDKDHRSDKHKSGKHPSSTSSAHHSKDKGSSSNNGNHNSEKTRLADAHQSAVKEGMPVARRIKPHERTQEQQQKPKIELPQKQLELSSMQQQPRMELQQKQLELPSMQNQPRMELQQKQLELPSLQPKSKTKLAVSDLMELDWNTTKMDSFMKTKLDLDEWAKAEAKTDPKVVLEQLPLGGLLPKVKPEVVPEVKPVMADPWAIANANLKAKVELEDPWAIANANLKAKADMEAWALANAGIKHESKLQFDPWTIVDPNLKQPTKGAFDSQTVVKPEKKKSDIDAWVTAAAMQTQKKLEQLPPKPNTTKLEQVVDTLRGIADEYGASLKFDKHKLNVAQMDQKPKPVNVAPPEQKPKHLNVVPPEQKYKHVNNPYVNIPEQKPKHVNVAPPENKPKHVISQPEQKPKHVNVVPPEKPKQHVNIAHVNVPEQKTKHANIAQPEQKIKHMNVAPIEQKPKHVNVQPEQKPKQVNAVGLVSDPHKTVQAPIQRPEVRPPPLPETKVADPVKSHSSEKRDKHRSKHSHSKDRSATVVDHPMPIVSTKDEPAQNGRSSTSSEHPPSTVVEPQAHVPNAEPFVMLERMTVKPEKTKSSSSEKKEKHKSSKHSKDKSSNHSPGIKVTIPKHYLEDSTKPPKPIKIKLPKPPPIETPPPTTSLKLVITKDKYGSGSYSASSHKHRKRHRSKSPNREHKHQKTDKSSRHSRGGTVQNSQPPLPPPLPPPPPPPLE